jgi:hypothetical protein
MDHYIIKEETFFANLWRVNLMGKFIYVGMEAKNLIFNQSSLIAFHPSAMPFSNITIQ